MRACTVMFTVATLMVVASVEISAQPAPIPPPGERLFFGEGVTSCGSWTQARQTRSLQQGRLVQWVAGYLSGANMDDDTKPEALLGTDFNGLMAWIDNYCQAHPLNNVFQLLKHSCKLCGHVRDSDP
jgi:hypothetical protein